MVCVCVCVCESHLSQCQLLHPPPGAAVRSSGGETHTEPQRHYARVCIAQCIEKRGHYMGHLWFRISPNRTQVSVHVWLGCIIIFGGQYTMKITHCPCSEDISTCTEEIEKASNTHFTGSNGLVVSEKVWEGEERGAHSSAHSSVTGCVNLQPSRGSGSCHSN